jgi:hypothetical protein
MIDRIRRSRSTGLAVHDQTESVFTIDRNTQSIRDEMRQDRDEWRGLAERFPTDQQPP